MSDPSPQIRIDWDKCRQKDWQRLVDRATACPFEQSWLYGAAHAEQRPQNTVRRAILTWDGRKIAFAQVLERRFGRIATLAQILRGPVLLDETLPPDVLSAVYRRLYREYRGTGRRLLFWTPELPNGAETDALMRTCGTRRLVTGYASARLDLTRDPDTIRRSLHGKWRNALVKAELSGLSCRLLADPAAMAWLLDAHDRQRKAKRFGGPDAAAFSHIAAHTPAKDLFAIGAYDGSAPVAGALFLRHGQVASYLIGWNDAKGRAANAGNLLLWNGILELHNRATGCLDLGGVDTRRAAGIARFKLGLGAEPYRIAGTFA